MRDALLVLAALGCGCATNGGAGPGGDDDGGCSELADACGGETICIAGQCEAAFPRVYSITNVNVTVPTKNPNNGQDWDVGGGAPDLYLGDHTGAKLSNVVEDSFSASFAGPLDFSLIAGGTLELDVWDEDLTSNDPGFGCIANPITAAQLRARSFSCTTSGASLTSTINPK